MNEFIIANLLFQVGASTALMLVAGMSAARELHVNRPVKMPASAAQARHTVIELHASRSAKTLPDSDMGAQSKAA